MSTRDMDSSRWQRVDELFHRALAMTADERDAFLARECAGDDDLRESVERLIAADERPHELVDRLEGGALRPPSDPLIGREVGRYRLTARIAAGGMGMVYRAERTDGLFRHEVAIKLIRIELATPTLVRRFELERRALAALHHPNIAQLHDGGTTAEGRPYLVMEYVRGLPIDRYCDENMLGVEERLKLFEQVCRAVHFAHQNLIVHRDLKPANILIDDQGVPKLLDFGIARLLDESADADAPSLTLTGAPILTPDYASPEQLTAGPVTTAMDVYSLGVVLYELLTGRRPFHSDTHSPVEWHRAVLERTPTKPSTRVVTPDARPTPEIVAPSLDELAARSGSTPSALRRKLRGDIDLIVLMALRKEPERRYASAKDLADDIERHFSGHPLHARPDSFTYRASRFVQRNRLAVGSAVTVLVVLVAGLVMAHRGERRAMEQAEVARAERKRAEDQALHARVEAESFQGIADFLMGTFLSSRDDLDAEEVELGRHRIRAYAARLRREYADQDHLRANLLDSLGHVSQRLGLRDDAESLVREALEIRTRAFGEQSLEYALSLRSLGQLCYDRGELREAARYMEQALALHRERRNETHTDVAALANDLAACLRSLGRLDEAESLHREALASRRADGGSTLAVAESLNNLAGIHLDRNDLATAAGMLEESLAIRRTILGAEDPLTLQSLSNLATTRRRMGENDLAYSLLAEAEAGCRARLLDGETDLAQILSNRAAMLLIDGRYDEAQSAVGEALDLQSRRLGARHPSVASTLAKQAYVQDALGRREDARASWLRALEIRRAPGGSPRHLAQTLFEYGRFLANAGEREDAVDVLKEAVAVLDANGGARTPQRGNAVLVLGELLLAMGDAPAALPRLEEAVAVFSEISPGGGQELERARAALASCTDAGPH